MKSSETDRTNEGGGYAYTCKKNFYVFLFWSRFLTFFYFPNVFLFLKNVGKVQSGKQINKKHFQNDVNYAKKR